MSEAADSFTEARARVVALIAAARAEGHDALVVFDLDGTLYDNSHRTLRILQEYAHTHAGRQRAFYDRLRHVAPRDLVYRVEETVRMLGFGDEALIAEVTAFWQERFFTSAYCLYDLPLAGAREFVALVYEAGGVPTFLTGRDAPNMLAGTLEALQRDGFPVGRVDTRIILKPHFDLDDNAFKASVIGQLARTGRVVASFDNEPGLCNLFKEAFPAAVVAWLRTGHAPGAPSLRDDVLHLMDFASLLPPGSA